jgi:predicted amidohydrolase
MTRRLRLALLHLAPEVGAVESNRALVERVTRLAAGAGADWVVSGELVVSGYRFAPVIGVDWIRQQPDTWMAEFARLHRKLGVVSFLSHPERGCDGALFNSLFVIGRDGEITGRQRKLYPIPVSEDWSSPGELGSSVTVDGSMSDS